MINLILLSTIIPLFIGIIVYLLASINNNKYIKEPLFLLHNISSTKYAKSLSEISRKKLREILLKLQNNGLHFSAINSHSSNSIALTFDDGLSSIYRMAFPILKEFNSTATLFITTAHLSNQKTVDVYNNIYLTEKEIIELNRSGFEIASHTVTHRALTLLPEAEIIKELKDSKDNIEKITNCKVTKLSFPLGLWNDEIIDIAKTIGYTDFYAYGGIIRANRNKQINIVRAIYPFYSSRDIMKEINCKLSPAITAGRVINHFAKGTPLWKFDKNYSLLKAFRYINPLK